MKTVAAVFASLSGAGEACFDLKHVGVPQEDISLIACNEASLHDKYPEKSRKASASRVAVPASDGSLGGRVGILAMLVASATSPTVCGVFLLASTLQAESIIVYDSTAQTSGGSDAIQGSGPLYDSFSTGTNSGVLSGVTLLLQGDNTSASLISVDLYADSGSSTVGAFVTNLAIIPDSSLSGSEGSIDVSLTENPDLAAFTRYWIGLTGSDSTGAWFWTTDVSGTGVAGEFLQNTFGTFPNDTEGGYQMQVEITPAPDPPTFFLGAAGLAALTLSRRRHVGPAAL